jgi:photoactive yellow protein
MDAIALDALDFGVIHFDQNCVVRRYNLHEQTQAGLGLDRVLGKHVFTELAQCMNNFMVAEKFVEAKASGHGLDSTIDYVLTWKMKPTPVKLRMLSDPGEPGGYVILQRQR